MEKQPIMIPKSYLDFLKGHILFCLWNRYKSDLRPLDGTTNPIIAFLIELEIQACGTIHLL